MYSDRTMEIWPKARGKREGDGIGKGPQGGIQTQDTWIATVPYASALPIARTKLNNSAGLYGNFFCT